MTRRIYRWVRKIYALLLLIAAAMGIQPGKPAPVPGAPPATAPVPPSTPAPMAPTPPAKKQIGSCATADGIRIDGSKGFFATCVVDGAQYTLPGDYPTRAAAQQAIRDFRAANA